MGRIALFYTLIIGMSLLFPPLHALHKFQHVFTPAAAFGSDMQPGSSSMAAGGASSESYGEETTAQSGDAAVHNEVGITYYKSGMYKEAITAFQEAIRIMPDYADAYRNLGAAYYKAGMTDDAVEAFKLGISLEPGHSGTYENLGIVYLKSGRFKEAREAFAEAVRMRPGDAVAHYQLGVAYYESGMNEQAAASFEEAIKIKPDYAGAQYNLGLAYAKGNDGASSDEGPATMKKQDIRSTDRDTLPDKAEGKADAEPLSIYTIQLGSFIKAAPAQKLFASVVRVLTEDELDNLRIEKIGKYYSVRISKFNSNGEAKKFLASVKSRIPDGIIMKAFFIEDRIERMYEPAKT